MEHDIKRVLCVIGNMNAGGAETFLMKLYRNMDRTRYRMDFCLQTRSESFYEKEILSLGGRVFRIPPKSEDVKGFKRGLSTLIREQGYEYVLRITSNAMGLWDLKLARRAGARVCIARSSNSSDGGGLKSRLAHSVGRLLYGRYVDVRIAPSDLAARHTFGSRAYRTGKVHILHNAVQVDSFAFSSVERRSVRDSLGIAPDAMVVGHVGRFMKQKNHGFLLEVFAAILRKNPDARLLLVGNGILEGEVRAACVQKGISDCVIFTGLRSDIPALLSAMDIFVFPSLYEGMPNTVIEAQANGLPCVIADTITREAAITGLVHYLPLDGDAEAWADAAMARASAAHADTHTDFLQAGYDIESVTEEFVHLVFDA